MTPNIAVIVPCFKVKDKVLSVVERIGSEVRWIVAVDDKCPQCSGKFLEVNCADPRLTVIYHEANQGVGGSVLTGFAHAHALGADVLVKLDGDGQMDPQQIPRLVRPILQGNADYTKGNRFYRLEDLRSMPRIRLFGNAGLSFLTKLSSGYWGIFDPTNGFTALHAKVFGELPLPRISRRYFFESDMLYHLNILRAKVVDVPMPAVYRDEISNLSLTRSFFEFFMRNMQNLARRIFYSYFLRDFTMATLELVFGLVLIGWGTAFGVTEWIYNVRHEIATPAGTVMLAALPIILGIQMLLAFLSYDMSRQPAEPIHPQL
jgi:dolichol-phosphate mannosyltransferase